MRADGRVAIFNCDAHNPSPASLRDATSPLGEARRTAESSNKHKKSRANARPFNTHRTKLFLTKIYSCRMLAMRAASLTAAGITANAATGFMCLDDLLGCQIHTTNNNQTNNPGCHTKHLFYFASMLITVSLLYFLAGRKSRYRNAIRKTTATPVPKLNASPPTNTLPNW